MKKNIIKLGCIALMLFGTVTANAATTNNNVVNISGTNSANAGKTATVMLVKSDVDGTPADSDIAYFSQFTIGQDGKYDYSFPYNPSEIAIGDYEVSLTVNGEPATETIEAASSTIVTDLIDVDFNIINNDVYGYVAADINNKYNVDITSSDVKLFLAAYDNNDRLTDVKLKPFGQDAGVRVDLNGGTKIKCFVWQDMKPLYTIPEETLKTPMNIVCWGDSLTQGTDGKPYPQVLGELTGVNVANFGIAGEDAAAIAGRRGAASLKTGTVFTIPAETTPVRFALAEGILLGVNGLNPCTINGVEGSITVTNQEVYFTRAAAGEAVTVNSGTPIISNSTNGAADIEVIWIGANDRTKITKDTDAACKYLIEYQKAMAEKAVAEGGDYLVVGIAWGVISEDTLPYYKKLEREQAKQFGENYLNLRKELTNEANYSGITLTANDKAAMEKGLIPPSILGGGDNSHFNAAGYELVASIIQNKLAEMGLVVGK